MEIVQCNVALGGDLNNTVPKAEVTIAELALLRVIHGEDAVRDVEVTGETAVSSAEELARLRETYPARDHEGRFFVNVLYPGAAPRLYQKLAELALPESLLSREQFERLRAAVQAPAKANRPVSGKGRGKKPVFDEAPPVQVDEDDEEPAEVDADPEPDDLAE